MKTKLQTLLAVLTIIFSIAEASAQQPAMPPAIDPATGLPLPPQPNIDTATGLPADGSPPFKDSNGTPTWIDPGWPEPHEGMSGPKTLASVDFLSLPLTEVARKLREQFNNYFDVILPGTGSNPINPDTGQALPGFDPTQINVELQLKNVTASEIFSAMNLQFELNRSPLRWELTLNGMRPTAILRNLPQLVPPAPPEPPAPPQIRKTFFVGDMLDDYPGTNDEDKLASITTNILSCTSGTGVVAEWGGKASKPRFRVKIAEYPPAQLLIVSGTPDEVDFVEQILRGLKDKAEHDKVHSEPQPEKSQ